MRHPLALAALLTLAACGGGGGGSAPDVPPPPPAPVTVDILVDSARSGFIPNGGQANVGVGAQVGDLATNAELRGFYTFPLGTIPSSTALTAAELRVPQTAVSNGTPYSDFSALTVETVAIDTALDGTDFGLAALASPGNLAPFDATLGVKTLDVLSAVKADLDAARTVSTFRLRFGGAPSNDAASDRATFGLNTSPNVVVLHVTYQP